MTAKLKDGEIICDECNGAGKITDRRFVNLESDPYVKRCPKCHGDGKLDWVENIVGKTDDFQTFNWRINETELDTQFKDWVDASGKAIADSVDKDIIEKLTKEPMDDN